MTETETVVTDIVMIGTLLVLGLYDQAAIINGDSNIEWIGAGIIGDHYHYYYKQIDTGESFGHSFWSRAGIGLGWAIK